MSLTASPRTLLSTLALALLLSAPGFAQMPQGPGKEHEILKDMTGKWTVKQKFRMSAEAPWMNFEGTETGEMVCGGMWVQTVYKVPNMMGMSYEGRMTLGYDPAKKKYVGTWIDSMAPYIMPMEATYDAKTKTMNFVAQGMDPDTGKMVENRMTSTITGKDTVTFRMYSPVKPDQPEFLTMELLYTRKK